MADVANLARNEGVSHSNLTELIDIEPITLGRIVDRLETQGLVERRPHERDRRIWLLFLREAALPLLGAMPPIAEAMREEAHAGVSEALIRARNNARQFGRSELLLSRARSSNRASLTLLLFQTA